MVFESQSTSFFKLLFVSSILADTAIISNAVLNVKCELIMPVGLLEPTNIYIVFKGLGRQILILCHLLGVHLRSTLESLRQRLQLIKKMQGSPGGKNAIPST